MTPLLSMTPLSIIPPSHSLLCCTGLLVLLSSAVNTAPTREQLDVGGYFDKPGVCDSDICQSTSVNYNRERCQKDCPGQFTPATDPMSASNEKLTALEEQVRVLQGRSDVLLVLVILLFLCLPMVGAVVVYRETILTVLIPSCCSSDYKRRMAKKKQAKRSARNNSHSQPAGVTASSVQGLHQAASDGEGRQSSSRNPVVLDRRRSKSVCGVVDPGRHYDTVIANNKAIDMSSLQRREPTSTSPNPEQRTCSLPKPSTPGRVRHPSESSCAAEVFTSSFGDKTPPSPRGYFNDGMSSSSPGLSRTSCSTTPMTLSASNLLKNDQQRLKPQQDTSPNSNTSSNAAGISPGLGRSVSRRPSSPDTEMHSTNIMSNATMDTTISTLHSHL